MGFSTFPRKSMVSVALSITSSRKDLLKRTDREELSFDRSVSLVAVAAAASVPSSLMFSTALWANCKGKKKKNQTNKHQRPQRDTFVKPSIGILPRNGGHPLQEASGLQQTSNARRAICSVDGSCRCHWPLGCQAQS